MYVCVCLWVTVVTVGCLLHEAKQATRTQFSCQSVRVFKNVIKRATTPEEREAGSQRPGLAQKQLQVVYLVYPPTLCGADLAGLASIWAVGRDGEVRCMRVCSVCLGVKGKGRGRIVALEAGGAWASEMVGGSGRLLQWGFWRVKCNCHCLTCARLLDWRLPIRTPLSPSHPPPTLFPRVVALHVRMRATAVRNACAVSVSGWGVVLWERLDPMQCGRGFRLVVVVV